MSTCLHPRISLLKAYDTENDEDERREQTVPGAQHVEALRSAMDRHMLCGCDVYEGPSKPFYAGPADTGSDE